MDDYIELGSVGGKCGIDSHSMYKMLLKYGNKYGIKVMSEVDNRTVVSSSISMRIIELIAAYESKVPELTKIINCASDSIKFLTGHAVYFLLDDLSIIYIGQTKSLATRIGEHKKTKKFNAVYCIEHDNAIELEAFCISKYNPPLNIEIYGQLLLVDMCTKRVLEKLIQEC